MTILRTTKQWSRPSQRHRLEDLTPDEQGRVRAALVFLSRRFGSWEALAKVMNVKVGTACYSGGQNSKPSAGIALRAARAAGVPLEDILSGAFPPAGACPSCGRSET